MKINVLKSQRVKNLNKLIIESVHYFNDFLISIYLRIKYLNKSTNDIAINFLTASDENFYIPLMNLLKSLKKYYPESEVKIYNLGLNTFQIENINESFKNAIVLDFDFSKYPEFVSKRDEYGKLGSYAWKSSIIEENKNSDTLVLWMDSANLLEHNLNLLKLYLLEFGFYSPYSNGKIREWTHPDTLNFLDCSENLYSKRNLTGGIVGLNPKSEFGTNLISKWHKLCMISDCISPIGSSRENHRQDQSVLSVLFHQERKNIYFKTKKISNILVNQNPSQVLYLYGTTNYDDFKKNWYKKYEYLSTNTVYKAKHIFLLTPEFINKIPKKVQKKVTFIFLIKDLEVLKNNKIVPFLNNKNLFITLDKKISNHLNLNLNINSKFINNMEDSLENAVLKHLENN